MDNRISSQKITLLVNLIY